MFPDSTIKIMYDFEVIQKTENITNNIINE